MVNWTKAQTQVKNIVSKNGVWLQWLERVASGSNAFSTGSSITYGYGDDTIYYVTGSVKAVVEHVKVEDIVLDVGFYAEDYERIYVDPSETIEFWDQIIYPSGSGIKYLILPLHDWRLTIGDTIVAKYANIRRLFPKSGSAY
jgi:hypothetical protein